MLPPLNYLLLCQRSVTFKIAIAMVGFTSTFTVLLLLSIYPIFSLFLFFSFLRVDLFKIISLHLNECLMNNIVRSLKQIHSDNFCLLIGLLNHLYLIWLFIYLGLTLPFIIYFISSFLFLCFSFPASFCFFWMFLIFHFSLSIVFFTTFLYMVYSLFSTLGITTHILNFS